MRAFAVAALAALATAQFEDLDLDIPDECAEGPNQACYDAIENFIRDQDYEGLIMDEWEGAKDDKDYTTAMEQLSKVDDGIADTIDAAVENIAEAVDATIKSSKLIDPARWEAAAEDVAELTQNPPNTSEIEEKAEEMSKIPEELLKDLEGNAALTSALADLEDLVGYNNNWNGSAVSALRAVDDLEKAFEDLDGDNEASVTALKDAIAASTVAQDQIDAVLTAALAATDAAVGEIEDVIQTTLEDDVPDMMDRVKAIAPGSIDSMLDDAWSDVNQVITAVRSDSGLGAVRSAVTTAIGAEAYEITGNDKVNQIVEKSVSLSETVGASAQKLAEDLFGTSLTASVAAIVALAPVLAF